MCGMWGSQSYCERNLYRAVYQNKRIKTVDTWDVGYFCPIFDEVNYIVETVKEGALPP